MASVTDVIRIGACLNKVLFFGANFTFGVMWQDVCIENHKAADLVAPGFLYLKDDIWILEWPNCWRHDRLGWIENMLEIADQDSWSEWTLGSFNLVCEYYAILLYMSMGMSTHRQRHLNIFWRLDLNHTLDKNMQILTSTKRPSFAWAIYAYTA